MRGPANSVEQKRVTGQNSRGQSVGSSSCSPKFMGVEYKAIMITMIGTKSENGCCGNRCCYSSVLTFGECSRVYHKT
ncbi:hypothetical protein CSKR_113230 [Clonorchis sinensis]|uniref:Uncharacterized protein n=2 Tax=Clonorchis sinensis TaxID=79923 RepID=A0A8T1M9B4_CLOSI|nr:hypothetical protein CSKR_113230 [Clonorchis sinensis]GAA48021.1 hypothetical protein CLF_101086 [Clonorchis sinensis]